eukprot:2998335-Rhodomonas_salina.1
MEDGSLQTRREVLTWQVYMLSASCGIGPMEAIDVAGTAVCGSGVFVVSSLGRVCVIVGRGCRLGKGCPQCSAGAAGFCVHGRRKQRCKVSLCAVQTESERGF